MSSNRWFDRNIKLYMNFCCDTISYFKSKKSKSNNVYIRTNYRWVFLIFDNTKKLFIKAFGIILSYIDLLKLTDIRNEFKFQIFYIWTLERQRNIIQIHLVM